MSLTNILLLDGLAESRRERYEISLYGTCLYCPEPL